MISVLHGPLAGERAAGAGLRFAPVAAAVGVDPEVDDGALGEGLAKVECGDGNAELDRRAVRQLVRRHKAVVAAVAVGVVQ